jgi:cytochrome c oxidase subunit 2
MRPTRRPSIVPPSVPSAAALAATLALAACTPATPNSLNPQGPAAAEIARLWWILFAMGAAIYLLVVALVILVVVRRRREHPVAPGETSARAAALEADERERSHARWVVWGGIVLPVVVLSLVLFFTVTTLRALSAPETRDEDTIRLVGRQWWWEVLYPVRNVVAANEIHIPVGRAVRIELESADVIHSFWVPELHGKLDMIPGKRNVIWIQADRPGEYLSLCAEFCGTQHAKMLLIVVAEAEEEYEAWLAQQAQPIAPPADALLARGQEVFLAANCVECHTVRGTHATGNLGPDLTHVGSRRTLAAGTEPNTLGSLAGWIVDAQHVKPGNLMPTSPMPPDDLTALAAWMLSLK